MRKLAIYREDGGKFLVEVLSDETKGNWRRVHLHCVKTVREASHRLQIPIGTEWISSAIVGMEHIVGWSLTSIERSQ